MDQIFQRLLTTAGPSGFEGALQEVYKEQMAPYVDSIETDNMGNVIAVNIPAGQWHTVKALESGTVILEMKDGAYEPTGPEDILEL